MKPESVKVSRFQNRYRTYLELLIELRSEMSWFFNGSEKSKLLTVPFILTLAAALECSLNDHLIKHFEGKFGETSKQMLPGFMSMTFNGKLVNIVPILTNYKYSLNTQHRAYAAMVQLIKLRNSLVHNKSDFEIREFENENYDSIKNFVTGESDFTFGIATDIGLIHDAVEEFHTQFLEAYSQDNFSGNELIVPLTENEQIILVFER